MFSVSPREAALLLAILAALVVGAAVKHWRDVHREQPAPAAEVAAPR